MRYSTLLPLALLSSSALAADQQFPFKAWFDKAASYIPSGVAHPIDTASARTASKHVTALTKDNWQTVLGAHPPTAKAGAGGAAAAGQEEWWVFFTGGNNTCFGKCDRAEKAFNETASLLQASSHKPHFAMANCDRQPLLCVTLAASVPSVWQVLVPSAPETPTPIRIQAVNTTTVSASELMSMHTTKSWKLIAPYEGLMHPFDGPLAKLGLNIPVGYVLWAFSAVPNWMFMIGLSFLSRSFMGRRTAPQGARTAPIPGAGQPVQAAAI